MAREFPSLPYGSVYLQKKKIYFQPFSGLAGNLALIFQNEKNAFDF